MVRGTNPWRVPGRSSHGRPHDPQGVAGGDRLLGRRAERRPPRLRRRGSAPRTTLRAAGRRRPADDRGGDRRGRHSAGSIVHQAVFVADVQQIDECRQIIRDFYGERLARHQLHPAAALRRQAAGDRGLGVGQGRGEVEIERLSEQLVIARHNGIAWVHCRPRRFPRPSDRGVYDALAGRLRADARSCWRHVNVRFDQVIRTWLYLGDIVDDEGRRNATRNSTAPAPTSTATSRFLADRLPHGLPRHRSIPASTGIGTEGRGIMMSAIALATDRTDIVAVPLENPRQTAAYDYAAHYSPKSPKFSRAMALSCGDLRHDLRLRHGEHHGLGDAARRRRRGPDPRNARQHRRADLRGESLPPRPARAGHLAGQPGLGAASTSSGRRTTLPSAPSASSGWANCPRSTPWPTSAGRNCWSRSRRWPSRRSSRGGL